MNIARSYKKALTIIQFYSFIKKISFFSNLKKTNNLIIIIKLTVLRLSVIHIK